MTVTVSGNWSQRSRAGMVRLYTHNIWARYGNWPVRRRVLVDGIRELEPDIVVLQKTMVTDSYDQVVDLLGYSWHVAHSKERDVDGMGVSIASRWPIREVYEPDLNVTSRTGDFACTALFAEIDAPTPIGPLLIINHFPDYQVDHERERELQTVFIARLVEDRIARRPTHVIVAGDLDAEPDAASLRFLSGKQSLDGLNVCYRNAWDATHSGEHGATFVSWNAVAPGHWPFARIDHIFVRCGVYGGPTLRIAGCELAFHEPVDGVWASNHFGLVADLASDNDLSPLGTPDR